MLKGKYSVTVLDYKGCFQLIYGNGGMPKDKTVYERIRFFHPECFSWSQETEVKPYFVVLQDGKKVVGMAKIGQYKMNNHHEKDYSLSFLSIDIAYRNKGLARVIVDKLFEFLKDKDFELKTSSYTYVGKIKLQKILNEMATKWEVKFTDRKESDSLIDYDKMYDENLNHIEELQNLKTKL